MGLYNPNTFTAGGLPVNDANLKWTGCGFGLFDYDGKANTVAFHVTYQTEDGESHPQQYSVGDPARWDISKDGRNIVPKVEGAAVSKNSMFGKLMTALLNAGVPENVLNDADGIDVLDDLVTFNIGQPRNDLQGKPVVDEQGRPKTTSMPAKIVSAPWDNKKGGKSGKGKTAAAASDSGDTAAEVADFLRAQIAMNDGEITRQAVAQAMFADKKLAAKAGQMSGLIFGDAAFLTDNGFALDGEVISLA